MIYLYISFVIYHVYMYVSLYLLICNMSYMHLPVIYVSIYI